MIQSDPSDSHTSCRPKTGGKFLRRADEKFYVRGVTYGPFRPGRDGNEYGDRDEVERDFMQISAHGMNAIRTYTVPPLWMLDAAQSYGLSVMVGLPWAQHVAFLDDHRIASDVERRVRDGVSACAGHPAVLCYAIGNEIPASIVRWHGPTRMEHYLERLYKTAKMEDPEGLVTYVNFPSTEYLRLDFLDLLCFNVYLEWRENLEGYIARLQNLAGERPLLMGEIGLDSRRNGEQTQASVLDWQIRSIFSAGCAGSFVFAWTDEWHRGGEDIEDWEFGLTRRNREPKPALVSVRQAFADVPLQSKESLPRISVVVCTHNGSTTIRDCLDGMLGLTYPNFEVLVVDDGSEDDTASIARNYGFRVIRTQNRGLSCARNTGLEVATGEIVAYTDDDARPDPEWLTYLALGLMNSSHVGIGGPNIAPQGDGVVAECVANAPGAPTHVLLSDREAEHIPGCNMAFRKEALTAIGGFDPQFRSAGDDVDVCWRLRERGWTLGFSPGAMVWHHRRHTVRAYWKQQKGYGMAEALLEKKWPEKYNTLGHLSWTGRIYGPGLARGLGLTSRIYHGVWGTAPFQSLYRPEPKTLHTLPLMPEWYLFMCALAAISALGPLWQPFFWAFPLLLGTVLASCARAAISTRPASFSISLRSPLHRIKQRSLTIFLYLLQPIARLRGRLSRGLSPWRRPKEARIGLPTPHNATVWCEVWQSPETWLGWLEAELRGRGLCVSRGGVYDRWDLQVRGGLFASLRARMAVEEHGSGKQLLRFRAWPVFEPIILIASLSLIALAIVAALGGGLVGSAVLAGLAALSAAGVSADYGAALTPYRQAPQALAAKAASFLTEQGETHPAQIEKVLVAIKSDTTARANGYHATAAATNPGDMDTKSARERDRSERLRHASWRDAEQVDFESDGSG